MRKLFTFVVCALLSVFSAQIAIAQQLPDPGFEDWSGDKFDGKIQPAYWHFSNVNQLGFNFNFANQVAGRSGYAMMVQDQDLKVAGFGETSPGYISLGQPWVYISGLTAISKATAGTYGGIDFSYRPDSISVWVKRTGNNYEREDFHILFYSWNGTAIGTKYKNKDMGCTEISRTDEESDVRQALNGNECGTAQMATQVAEGWLRERKEYKDWTQLRIPIYYMNSEVPEKCNVIFSAGNYPNFRANSGLYAGNALYVDDVELIYSSKIDQLYIGGRVWNGFDPNSTEEQVYSVGDAAAVPAIEARRGVGQLTNAAGNTVSFPGRVLSNEEITIQYAPVGEVTTLTVRNNDNASSQRTYHIRFVKEPSHNANLYAIYSNGEAIKGFNGYITDYLVTLPYGTTAVPVITATAAEDGQQITIQQAKTLSTAATIKVIAPDNTTTQTYTIRFEVAPLADNTLENILVNSEPIKGFVPTLNTYRVELPLGTNELPQVQAVSAYPQGEQTITITQPSLDQLDGGICQIAVQVPGNTTTRIYKLTYKITASTYSLLADLHLGDYLIDFSPERTTYYVNLPLGTTQLPELTYEKGDQYQTVDVEYGGIDGTTRLTVTAASGDQTIYKIICTTEKSDIVTLKNILLDGKPLDGFLSDQLSYSVSLPIGTTSLPTITVEQGDEYQQVEITTAGINGITRIVVTAGDGSSVVYLITFSVEQANNTTFSMIYLDGQPLSGFSAERTDYTVSLPKGTSELPAITWDLHDEYQTVTLRSEGVNGVTRITVRAQSGATATYTITFSVEVSDIAELEMIYLDGQELTDFSKSKMDYTITLPVGVSILPEVTFQTADDEQKVLSVRSGNVHTITVTAGSGRSLIYTITFVIRKSENAYLKMIYLDGAPLSGFQSEELNYTYNLQFEFLPRITVDKEYGQQVIVLAPAYEGMARIIVRPESGESNTYTIDFVRVQSEHALLQSISIDGQPISDFDPSRLEYNLFYSTELPKIDYESTDDQQVTVQYGNDVVRIVVVSGEQQVVYVLNFNRNISSNTSLNQIFLDGEPLKDFDSAQYNYEIYLPAGSLLPTITWQKSEDTQTVFVGYTSNNECQLTVQAENQSKEIYTLHFVIEQYASTELLSISLDGEPIELESGKYTYIQEIDKGVTLPQLTYTTAPGQMVLSVNQSSRRQTILVQAESGATATYTIFYRILTSDNALLRAVVLNGDTLQDFDPNTFVYTHQLDWHTAVVPVITPVGAVPGQYYDIAYGQVNAATTVHVLAPDSTTEQTYTFNFPVYKSDNTALDDVLFDDIDFAFNPETTEYTIVLPYQMREVPNMQYFVAEPEQSVRYVNAPVSDTTKLIVTAENGDTRTYRFAFQLTDSKEQNILQQLSVVETGETLVLDNETINVTLPYGTTSFTLEYEKAYDEQTVILQPGGLYHPTIITVRSNRKDDADKIYTIIPVLETQNPAVLTSLSVNGEPIDNFDPNRFSYIVNIESSNAFPQVVANYNDGVNVQIIENDQWHWQAVINKGEFSNTYDIFYHYPNEIIPNADFTEWTTAKYNNANKPTDWEVPADKTEQINVFLIGTTKTGSEVIKSSETVVGFETKYSNPAGGALPAIMSITGLQVGLTVANGSTADFSDYVSFHNSPDTILANYYQSATADEGARFSYYFKDNKEVKYNHDFYDKVTTSTYTTKVNPLNISGKKIQGMNIAINATGKNKGYSSGARLYVDWLRFVYNSRLAALYVDGQAADFDGNTFTYTMPNAEKITLPDLTFLGEVTDQSQQIKWGSETIADGFSVRQASVRNFAEDGTSTDYQIVIRRPLSTVNTLASIKIGGEQIDEWNAEQADYFISLPFGQKNLPDIQTALASELQDVVYSWDNDTLVLTVTPEYGEQRVYSIHFVEQVSNDVTLLSLTADGVEYDPATTEYNVVADRLPDITFQKQSDGQTVILDNGVLTVIAEDGYTNGTYTISYTKPEIQTSGQLSAINLDDNLIEGFDQDTYDYLHEQPSITSFVRQYAQDSVFQTITPDSIIWTVFGSQTHTYRLLYPTDLSSNALLDNILINEQPLNDFLPQLFDYTIRSNDNVDIHIVPAENEQTVAVSSERHASLVGRDTVIYTISVTAENKSDQQQYTVTVVPNLTDDATLKMIMLDGVDLENFDVQQYQYKVILPVANPKTVDPKMPSVAWRTAQPYQQVSVEPAALGQTIYLMVESEDRTRHSQYELTIVADSSHNALLDGILVDGQPITSFSPERNYYSAWVTSMDAEVFVSSRDRYQTIEQQYTASGCVITVTAEDKRTVNQYTIDFYQATVSSDATLADIRLDNKSFTDYNPSLVPFTPMNNTYTIPLASGATLPDVSVVCSSEGQTVSISTEDNMVRLTVVAPNGLTTNTYTLFFSRILSSNADLQMIYIGTEQMANFDPARTIYTVQLPVGTTTIPSVYALRAEETQRLENSGLDGEVWSVDVVAEDGTRKTYVINFDRILSDVDYLQMLYEDGEELDGFDTHTYFYRRTLPAGTRRFPVVSWAEADRWQTVTVDSIVKQMLKQTCQYIVKAQNGNSSTYTVAYEIELSDNDNLAAIYLNNQLLQGFDPTVYEYWYTMPFGSTRMPLLSWSTGDDYQTVDTISTGLPGDMRLIVTAENGQQHMYIIHYSVLADNNTDLDMIYVGGAPVAGFDPERMAYTVTLPYGTDDIPVITFDKHSDLQNVTLTISGMQATLTVLAEDKTSSNDYVISFRHALSPEAHLANILLDGQPLANFQPDLYDYDVILPYGTTSLPQIVYVLQDESASVTMETQGDNTVVITVVSADEMNILEYNITFTIALCSENALRDILVHGESIEGYDPDLLEYTISYPIGTIEEELLSLDDISYILADSTETVSIDYIDATTILIIVTAQDGSARAYTIYQRIERSANSLLRDLIFDGVSYSRFAPQIFNYEYILSAGLLPPTIDAIAQDEDATVYITPANVGDTTIIYCVAPDGSESVYKVLFRYADYSEADSPTPNDVFVKVIPGTHQILVGTVRKDVTFCLYDRAGHLCVSQLLNTINPNDANIVIDGYGNEHLMDIIDNGSGEIFNLIPGQPYFYVFFEMGNKKIATGKIMIMP